MIDPSRIIHRDDFAYEPEVYLVMTQMARTTRITITMALSRLKANPLLCPSFRY